MMTDEREIVTAALLRRNNEELKAKLRAIETQNRDASETPRDGGEMKERVTRLEVEFEHVRKDLDEIKGDVKEIRLGMATKGNLITYMLISATLAAAVVGVFVGVLTYLNALGSGP